MNNNNSTPSRTQSGNGSPGLWTSPLSSPVGTGRPPSLLDLQQSLPNVVRVVVTRDGGGYGMKVSGDNPVYVQSVKDGGPAEKAGLHAGDKIIQVNGTNVMHSTHTDVVTLIKASVQVVLTVQQRSSPVRSPGSRPATIPSSTRITGPQPVDDEKQHQLQQEKEQYYRLMIEKEQHHLDKLRSQIASSNNEKKCGELAKAEKNLRILQDNLLRTLVDQHSPDMGTPRPLSSPSHFSSPQRGGGSFDQPPPLPKRNKQHDVNLLFLSNEINANTPRKNTGGDNGHSPDASGDVPPPLPPRTYPPYNNNTHTDEAPAVNSIDKQMSYPLVATCTSLHGNCSSTSPKHQRTKSSPESLLALSGDYRNAKSLDATDHNMDNWQQRPGTPPGTPPPPYPSPQPGRRDRFMMGVSCDSSFEYVSNSPENSFVEVPHSPRGNTPKILNNSPIRAANSRVAQQTIISMEDDDMSDLEIDQSEDHGHFKSLSRLWEHLPHLAVFMNYILSNSDPNSLLFYLLTDLYKEGNAKEMRKWAFEIHSCFLVPGAPLRLNNVDENVAREIDDDLTKEYDKEEIMRKIFWKARQRAKEELTRQLTDFQQKRTAGLGTIYGPTDQELRDHYNDKAKETKLYESLFLPKLEMYLEEIEKENYDPQKYFLAAALITVLTRVFRIRPQSLDLDRVPTFVNKERSFKSKFIGRYSRKLSHLSHQFVSQQYFTVIPCNYCHQIIYGISPQGYQCSACLINLHRPCVKLYDDSCPGPFKGKDRGIRKLIGMRHDSSEQNRIRKASHFIQMEKEKRQMEERDNRTESAETGKFRQLEKYELAWWLADTRNKNNMTSFRNKITNRKQKNSGGSVSEVSNDTVPDNKQQNSESDSKKQQSKQAASKAGKNRGRNRNKKEPTKAPPDDANNSKIPTESVEPKLNNNETKKVEENVDTCDGVVLRNSNNVRNGDAALKRYSDSFVIENVLAEESKEKEKVSNPTPLTRALSGFFVLDQSKKANRRFSDLFRPVSGKFSGSTESLKIPMRLEKNAPEKVDKKESKSEAAKNKANKKENAKKNSQTKSTEGGKAATTETSNSYLKRVKSKIYKSKSDDSAKIELDNKYKKLKPKKSLDLNGRIPEEDVPSPTSGLQKSLGPFQFGRLTRQTTNLERISRPFGSQKSVEGTETAGLERPVLAKSKSSSAINLSLLRTRRAKLVDQASAACASAAALCKDEFDFIAFGGVQSVGSTTSLHRFPSWLHLSKADTKVSQPVSRSGSDRRPDAVREEGARPAQDTDALAQSQDGHEDAPTPLEKSEAPALQDSSVHLQSGGVKRRAGSHINRSESVKEQSEKNRKQQRRNISDPSHTHNTSCDADFERQQILSKNTDSGSSSNSSISGINGRLSESPSNSMDVHTATVRTQSDSDSDMDGEADPLNWQELVTEEELKKLNPNEKKRQEVINELFLTEASHVRMLKVLYKLFYKSLQGSGLLKPDEMNLIFPNIKELLDVHTEINKEMRRIRKEDPLVRQIGDVLLATFTGPQGELLQRASATFCERQQLALEFIKKRRERDNKFESLLSDCEKKRQCRRLQLQGIVPAEMQRLTRYPLLLERLVKSVEAADKTCSEYKEELVKLRQAHHHSKDILGHVNEAAKLAHNRHRLEEIQRHLDISNFRGSENPIVHDFKNMDLKRYKLIIEGSLSLRRPNKAPVPVHILLLEEMVVILQKESEKFILKFFQSGSPTQQAPLSPIIKMNTLLVRENAVCKSALFLVNTSTTSSQMYDLQAEDEPKRETWLKHFSDAADTYNRREGKPSRAGGAAILAHDIVSDSDSESIREQPTEADSNSAPEGPVEVANDENPPEEQQESSAEEGDRETPAAVDGEEDADGDHTPDVAAGGGIQLTTKVSAEEWPLIQPSQVNVAVPPVHTAESMLTPLEQIRRKDALVKQALAEKEDLVADMLSIPREHFEHIADMASAESSMPGSTGHSDITDRLLASVFQVDILQKAVNDALNISEGEVLAARGGKLPVCISQEPLYNNETRSVIPSVPASLVRDISASLSLQLTTLLSEVKQVEEERDRLRKELHRVREKLHEEHNLHSPVPFDDNVASDESTQEVFCEAISDEPK